MSQDRGRNKNVEESLYRIPPYYYIHVLDQNTNITSLHVGPKTYIRQDNERYNRLTATYTLVLLMLFANCSQVLSHSRMQPEIMMRFSYWNSMGGSEKLPLHCYACYNFIFGESFNNIVIGTQEIKQSRPWCTVADITHCRYHTLPVT